MEPGTNGSSIAVIAAQGAAAVDGISNLPQSSGVNSDIAIVRYCAAGYVATGGKQLQCQNSCPPVPAGSFRDFTGLTASACGAGKYCPEGSFTEKECDVGFYCPANSGQMLSCPVGYACPAKQTVTPVACTLTGTCLGGASVPKCLDSLPTLRGIARVFSASTSGFWLEGIVKGDYIYGVIMASGSFYGQAAVGSEIFFSKHFFSCG